MDAARAGYPAGTALAPHPIMLTGAALYFTVPALVVGVLAILALAVALWPSRTSAMIECAIAANAAHVASYGRSSGAIRMPRAHHSATGTLATVRGKRVFA